MILLKSQFGQMLASFPGCTGKPGNKASQMSQMCDNGPLRDIQLQRGNRGNLALLCDCLVTYCAHQVLNTDV